MHAPTRSPSPSAVLPCRSRGEAGGALRRALRGACGPLVRPGRVALRAVLLPALLAAALVAGCAKSSDVERVDESNRVQDERLKALENDVGKVLADQRAEMEKLSVSVKAAQGRMDLVDERTERMANEQKAITEGLERSLADQRKLSRNVDDELGKMARYKLETDNDLDKMRIQVAELEKLLKSPIARLPAKTAADADFRKAYFSLINGEFDIAADQFAAFRKTYPQDERGSEALYRRGQAFFLLRRYDHALIPLFELVDKTPKHELATPARWMLARSLEETGDLKLAREFYAQLINDKTPYANDATRRVAFINRLFPRSQPQGEGKGGQ
jgi:TolA-binding protein